MPDRPEPACLVIADISGYASYLAGVESTMRRTSSLDGSALQSRVRRGDHLSTGSRRRILGPATPHFSEPELVELGYFIALTMGQQSWLRLLNIEHHEVLAGDAASMAPGFETPAALAASKSSDDYWARR